MNRTLTGYATLGLLLCLGVMLVSPAVTAADPKIAYFRAEACYRDLLRDRKRQQYRDQWLACIERFQDVYTQAPEGPWAAAGLYMSGKLYAELYERSRRAADKKEAVDLFERVIKRYPGSRYRQRAFAAVRAIEGGRKAVAVKKKNVPPDVRAG